MLGTKWDSNTLYLGRGLSVAFQVYTPGLRDIPDIGYESLERKILKKVCNEWILILKQSV